MSVKITGEEYEERQTAEEVFETARLNFLNGVATTMLVALTPFLLIALLCLLFA